MKTQKIVLSASRDIPLDKLVLSQANVRKIKTGVSIEELAEDIARRTLLQSLNVRPQRDEAGNETGLYEVPAGGRRFRALELLVKQKRMAKNQPVPCIVRDDGLAEEDSLAENVHREALHPLDQFRAFQDLREKGYGEDEIAARFFVAPSVVRQRLRLVSVSPRLLDLYADDELTLEQLMAFSVTEDHARQEQVWDSIRQLPEWSQKPHQIRRVLTEEAVRGDDARALFVGIEAYVAAGGIVARDLFEDDAGGWLQDIALLDRLAEEKLRAEAEAIGAEGWKWISAAIEFPYGYTRGLRPISGTPRPLSDEQEARRTALTAELDSIEEQYAEADEYPDEIDARCGEIEAALDALDNGPLDYDPAEMARAGAFVTIDSDGDLEVRRGYVRPEDDVTETDGDGTNTGGPGEDGDAGDGLSKRVVLIHVGGEPEGTEEPESDAMRPLSDRLVAELTAHRTLALRDAVARAPRVAFAAVLHALCLGAFYRLTQNTCLEITARSAALSQQAPGLKDSLSAKAIEERHEAWARRLPEDEDALWGVLEALGSDEQAALFAHVASLSVNALVEGRNRRLGPIAHSHVLAEAAGLDMVAAGWEAGVDNYFGRVSKARILEAVREGRDNASAQLIDHLKKGDMAKEAERLLQGTGWLPEPLRAAVADVTTVEENDESDTALPAFLEDEEEADTTPETMAA